VTSPSGVRFTSRRTYVAGVSKRALDRRERRPGEQRATPSATKGAASRASPVPIQITGMGRSAGPERSPDELARAQAVCVDDAMSGERADRSRSRSPRCARPRRRPVRGLAEPSAFLGSRRRAGWPTTRTICVSIAGRAARSRRIVRAFAGAGRSSTGRPEPSTEVCPHASAGPRAAREGPRARLA
jgi:hypothetical protein